MRVMVVDTTRLFRDGIANLLMVQGHEVVAQASNRQEALEMAAAATPELVLMDLQMPVMNGLDAIKARFPDMNVVVLTVSDDEEDLLEAVKRGGPMAICSRT